jgi:hypothetical protein
MGSTVCGAAVTDIDLDFAHYQLRDQAVASTVVQFFTTSSTERIDVRKWVFEACQGAGATVIEGSSTETLKWDLDGQQGRLTRLGSSLVLVSGPAGELWIDGGETVQQLITNALEVE